MISTHTDGFGSAERVEAVDDGEANLDFCGLAVGLSGGVALTGGFEAPHLCLDPVSSMVSGPALPERLAIGRVARRVSFLAIAPGQSSFQGRPFFRIGMIAIACQSIMAVGQRHVS